MTHKTRPTRALSATPTLASSQSATSISPSPFDRSPTPETGTNTTTTMSGNVNVSASSMACHPPSSHIVHGKPQNSSPTRLSPSPREPTTRYYRQDDSSKSSDFDLFEFRNPVTLNLCSLSWQNISYTVEPTTHYQRCSRIIRNAFNHQSRLPHNHTDNGRRILKNLWGRSSPGDLTAILGPSGAGKTTLLDLLADRIDYASGRIEGIVEVNGQPREKKTFRGLMSYVSQEMSFLGSFTVLETLQMAAGLSLPSHIPQLTREMRVQDVIDDMGLRNCARTCVGDLFHKGISNGQRKRLSIAIELLSNPSILLLDEPTSGLDSSSARRVMEHILKLCLEGKNVICTIHQPSSAIYEMLSNIVILSMGEQIYYGPANAALPHFFSIGYACPMYSNPAEYFVHLVNKDFHDQLNIEPFVTAWAESNEANTLKLEIARDRASRLCINGELLQAMTPSAWNQFCVLLHRNWLNNWRNPGVFWIRVLMYMLLTLMVGTMYLSSNHKITNEAMVPLLFYVQAFLVFMSVAALPALIEQRAVFQRETMNNSLHVVSFTTANFIGALPGIAVISVLASVIVVNLADVNSFASFLINLSLSLVVAESLMHVIGAAVPHYIIGIALGAGLFGMFMLCEGFMVPYHSMPTYWIWGYYLAFHTYSFEAFMYQHFSTVNTTDAWKVLEEYDMEKVNVSHNMGILILYAVVLQILFAVILFLFHTGGSRR